VRISKDEGKDCENHGVFHMVNSPTWSAHQQMTNKGLYVQRTKVGNNISRVEIMKPRDDEQSCELTELRENENGTPANLVGDGTKDWACKEFDESSHS
jgi:hypothetical protein